MTMDAEFYAVHKNNLNGRVNYGLKLKICMWCVKLCICGDNEHFDVFQY